MLIFTRFLLTFLITQLTFSFSLLDYKIPALIQQTVVDEFANLRISTNLDIIDGQVIDGLDLGFNYGYDFKPSYQKGKYERSDTWTIEKELKAGSLLDTVTPIYLNLGKGSEVKFVRHFDDRMKAIKARPYTLRNLPTDSQNLMTNLNANDFVSFSSRLYIALGAEEGVFDEYFGVKGKVESLIQGKFSIYLYKISDRFVRLKLVSASRNGISAGLEINEGDLLDGVSLVEDGIGKLVFLDFFEYKRNISQNSSYILDYVFDLNNPNARLALDNILKPQFKLTLKELWAKHQGIKYFEDKLITDFSLAEELVRKSDGVQRVFKGFNKFKLRDIKAKIGLLISQIDLGSAFYRNNITFEDEEGGEHHYFFPNKVTYYTERLRVPGFNRKDEIELSFHGLVPLQDGVASTKYSDVGISFNRRDRSLTKLELRKLTRQLRGTLPDRVFNKIDLSELSEMSNRRNIKVNYRIQFKENAFEELKSIEEERVLNLFQKFAFKSKKSKMGKFYNHVYGFITGKSFAVATAARRLHRILTRHDLTAAKRVEKLIDLHRLRHFKKYGFKVLTSLLPEERLADYIYVDLAIEGNDFEKYQFTYGTAKLSKIFKEILKMNNQFYKPSDDLRIDVSMESHEI